MTHRLDREVLLLCKAQHLLKRYILPIFRSVFFHPRLQWSPLAQSIVQKKKKQL